MAASSSRISSGAMPEAKSQVKITCKGRRSGVSGVWPKKRVGGVGHHHQLKCDDLFFFIRPCPGGLICVS